MKLSTTDKNTLLVCRDAVESAGLNQPSVRKLLLAGLIREFVKDGKFHVQTTDKGKQK